MLRLPLLLGAQAVALCGLVGFEGGAATACILLFGAANVMMTHVAWRLTSAG